MIYEIPKPEDNIRQGDIFIKVPLSVLPFDNLSVLTENDEVVDSNWEEQAGNDNCVAEVALRPVTAIVATTSCDTLRAPEITLMEVRPFLDVEGKANANTALHKLVKIIYQHCMINRKWFYLPICEKIGFNEKMAVDFLTPIRLSRVDLEKWRTNRIGTLNYVAAEHFRERLGHYYKQSAYNEWYSLSPEEFQLYLKDHEGAEPFPWQVEDEVTE